MTKTSLLARTKHSLYWKPSHDL